LNQETKLKVYVVVYTDDKNSTRRCNVEESSAERAWKRFEKLYPNYRILGLQDWSE